MIASLILNSRYNRIRNRHFGLSAELCVPLSQSGTKQFGVTNDFDFFPVYIL